MVVSSQMLGQSNSNRKTLWHVWKSGTVVLVGRLQIDIFCCLWVSEPPLSWCWLKLGFFIRTRKIGESDVRLPDLWRKGREYNKGAQLQPDPNPSKTFYKDTRSSIFEVSCFHPEKSLRTLRTEVLVSLLVNPRLPFAQKGNELSPFAIHLWGVNSKLPFVPFPREWSSTQE